MSDEIDSPWWSVCSDIKSVKIGEGITHIGNYAFVGSDNLVSVSYPTSLTTIGEWALGECESLAEVDLSGCTKLTTIMSDAFAYDKALSNLTLPAALQTIGKLAFIDCNALTEITSLATVPPTLTGADSGEDAFSGVPKDIPVNVPIGTRAAYTTALGWKEFTNINDGQCGDDANWSFDNVTKILTITGTGAMWNYEMNTNKAPWDKFKPEILSIVLSEGITTVGDFAFYNCISAQSVAIPTTLTSIGTYSFHRCLVLPSIDLSKCTNFTTIMLNVFWYCPALSSFNFPTSLETIGEGVFWNCGSLTTVDLSKCTKLTSIANNVFFLCFKLASVKLPA